MCIFRARVILAGLTICAIGIGTRHAAAAASATPSPAARGAHDPCALDRQKLCAKVERGEGRIQKCLREHADQLSDECKARVGKTRKSSASQPCAADAAKFCKGVERGEGRIIKCLDAHANDLSAECKQARASSKRKVRTVLPTQSPGGK